MRDRRKIRILIDKIIMGAMFCGIKKRPGAFIECLPKEDREILKEAKAEDFDYRWK